MKTTLLAFAALLIALSTQPLLGAADASPEQVVDTFGKKLRAGSNYYIVPVSTYPKGGTFGGLALASIGQMCPLDLVAVKRYQGLPLTFTPIDPKKGVVRVSSDLNIQFSAKTKCPQSTVWQLDHFDAKTGQWFVTTGGVLGNPGWQTLRNWFKIEKYDADYKLRYCPTVSTYKHLCKDVGLYVDEYGNNRLALSDVPIKVRFHKA
ncbi:hypothetical protein L6164_037024 [Bauhinia variegata]|uniref:Uncharacterized protein n=1 Tax=Bauhinia variegata TaxID=167791 RepID=A0ACB9KJ09_BAUVA|nr:hypothetical protein L6164_037024 [Bauhinia variegata]